MLIIRCDLCGAKRAREAKELLEGGRCGRCKEPVQPPSLPVHVSELELLEVSSELSVPLVAVFTTKACPRTKAMQRVLEAVAERFVGKALVLMIDVDANQNLAARLSMTTTPTFVVTKGVRPLMRHDGIAELSEVTRWIRAAALEN